MSFFARCCAIFGLAAAQHAPPCRGELAQLAPETSARAVERCVAEHESARLLRLREQWLEARAAMARCADPACPLAIRSDCSAWLEEVAQTLPTLLVVIERDDEGREPVELRFDDRTLTLPHELGPIEVLPGSHRLRFTLPGYAPVEQELTLAKGEKNRVVRVQFRRPPKPFPPPARRTPVRLTRPPRPVPTATYVFAGAAVTAFTASGVLLGSALSSLSSARESCSPACDSSDRESIEARLLAADVVGGVGVVLAGLSVYTFLRRPAAAGSEVAASPRLELGPATARLSWSTRF